MLKQNRNAPVPVELQVCIIYAVVNNILKEVAVEDVREFEQGLYEYMTSQQNDILAAIRDTGDMSKETAAKLEEALNQYKSAFLKTK